MAANAENEHINLGLAYLTQWEEMAEVLSKDPPPREGYVRGDGDRGDAHDDVRHSHVHQVHAGVGPQMRRPNIEKYF